MKPNQTNATSNTKPYSIREKPSLLRRLSKFVIKTSLIIILGATFFIYAAEKYPAATADLISYITTPIKYAKLMQQDPPLPNSLPNPITNAHLTDTWGAARSGGRKHEGIDIFAKRGTPIHSTTQGIVRKVGVDTLGGNVVFIIGPGGVSHYYAHLQSFADINEGDWIETSEVIGYVGDSGNAKGTPTHVHYGIYTATGAINPYPLLKK